MRSGKFYGLTGLLVVAVSIAVALVALVQQLYQGQLRTQAGLESRLSLKVLTYHYMNASDQSIPIVDLLAERGFVYFLAALCIGGVGASIGVGHKSLRPYFVVYIVLLSGLMAWIFLYAQYHATYALG